MSATASHDRHASEAPVEVFICYAEEDIVFRDELVKHAAPLVEAGAISVWHVGRLPGGARVKTEALARLENAAVVLALLTPNLLNSRDATALLSHAQQCGITTVPVLVQPCLWEFCEFAEVQPLPTNKQPVSIWSDREAAWLEIVRGLLETIQTAPSTS